jgi:lysylphosphatidylglycerol synthetase-like protein (DUF2156 family)
MRWIGWPLSRILLLFTGLAFLMLALQVYLFHSRQNFRRWVMWGPVIEAPLLGGLALIIAIFNLSSLVTAFTVLDGIAALAGLGGFYYHFAGVGERVDGYKLQNFLVGPPVVMPLLFTAISVLGLLALHWRY